MKKLTLFICFAVFMSCSENEADAPAMYNVNSVSLQTQSNQGSDSHNIKDLWMFLDGVDLGVFPVPANIPIIPENDAGNGIVQFSAGVRNNGINSTPIIYPFYDPIFEEKNLSKGYVEDLDLTFTYGASVKFAFIGTFEGENEFGYDEDGDGNIGITSTSVDVFEGARSGRILLNEDNLVTEVATNQTFDELPRDGSPIFMEMNYKTDVELNVGLIGFLGSNPIKNYKLVLNPTDTWNKVYIDFTFDIQDSQLDGYKILIGGGIESGDDPANIFVDNIKLVHF